MTPGPDTPEPTETPEREHTPGPGATSEPEKTSGEQLTLAGLPPAPEPRAARSGGSAGPGEAGPSPRGAALGSEGVAAENPVARVLLEAYVPHLDRVFDYRVSAALHEQAVVGAKVSVIFSGRKMSGWVVERVAHTDVPEERLLPIRRVLSPLPVAAPEIVDLAEAVAQRCAGTAADVLRVAIAPRVARVDKEFTAGDATPAPTEEPSRDTREQPSPGEQDGEGDDAVTASPEVWEHYTHGPEFITAVASGRPVRGVVEVLPSAEDHDWARLTANAMATAYAAGRGAVGVVADHKALERLETALHELVGRTPWCGCTPGTAPPRATADSWSSRWAASGSPWARDPRPTPPCRTSPWCAATTTGT